MEILSRTMATRTHEMDGIDDIRFRMKIFLRLNSSRTIKCVAPATGSTRFYGAPVYTIGTRTTLFHNCDKNIYRVPFP